MWINLMVNVDSELDGRFRAKDVFLLRIFLYICCGRRRGCWPSIGDGRADEPRFADGLGDWLSEALARR